MLLLEAWLHTCKLWCLPGNGYEPQGWKFVGVVSSILWLVSSTLYFGGWSSYLVSERCVSGLVGFQFVRNVPSSLHRLCSLAIRELGSHFCQPLSLPKRVLLL